MQPLRADDLQPKEKGDRIKHSEWNALIKGPRTEHSMRDGVADGNSTGSADKHVSTPRTVWAYATEEIPPYSVFGVTGLPPESPPDAYGDYSEPTRVLIGKIGTTSIGSHLTLFTNGPITFKAGWNYATPISMWDTYTLNFEGDIPPIGHPIGVKPDTYTVEVGRFGFACVGVGPDEDTIKVLRVPEPAKVFGKVTEAISPGSTPTLGEGKIKVFVRGASDLTTLAVVDPDTGETPWELTVYNARPRTYAVGTFVECTNTLGVGLLADYGAVDNSDSSGSGSGSCALSTIDDVDVLSLPIKSADDVTWQIAITEDGCVVRVPYGDCEDTA